MYSIFRKEVSAFLSSLIGYISVGFFLLATGLLFWVFPSYSPAHWGAATMLPFFEQAPQILLFLIPAITMRSFAEEKQLGTFELLATRPITDWQILLGKYFASIFLLFLSIAPTYIYYLSVYELGMPKGSVDVGAVYGSYLGLYFLGCVFVAIGLFASALFRNQMEAFIAALAFCATAFYGFSLVAQLPIFFGTYDSIIEKIGLEYHYAGLSRGLLDLRDVVYFLSVAAFFLLATRTLLQRR